MAYVKAREIREKLQGKIDPVQIDIMCALAERQAAQHQTMLSIAHAYDRLATMFGQVIQSATKLTPEGIRAALMGDAKSSMVESVKSFDEKDDDSGSTH